MKRKLPKKIVATEPVVVYSGTLQGFAGSYMSGLGFVIINGFSLPCDNAATVRALEGAFGNVIAENHTVNQNAITGKRIVFSFDEMGVFAGFTPEAEKDEFLENAKRIGYSVKFVEYGEKEINP